MGTGTGSVSPSRVRKRPRTQHVGASASAMRPPSDPASSSQRPPRRFSSFNATTTEPPGTSMRSLTELLGNGASRAEQALGDEAPDDAWASLANTIDNLGSSLLPGTLDAHDTRERYPRNIKTTNNDNDETDIDADISTMFSSKIVPTDLSIKNSLKVFSPKDLYWTRLRGQGEEAHAVRNFTDPNEASIFEKNSREASRPPIGSDAVPPSGTPTIEQVKAKRKFYGSLLHFRHPSFPLHSMISSNWLSLVSGRQIGGVRPERISEIKQLASQRLNDWQSALQSLYFGYRNGLVQEFYVVLASTTIAFNYVQASGSSGATGRAKPNINADKGEQISPQACISKATPGLRSLLSDQAVLFRIISSTEEDQDPCVLVEGEEEIHSLYNFLYSTGFKISNARDVPLLLSDTAFRWGTIVSAEVDYAKKVQRAGASSSLTAQCSASISGLFTPRQIKGICEAFSVMQENHFVLTMESEARSTRLNSSLDLRDADNGGNSTSGFITGSRVVTKIVRFPSKEEYHYSLQDVG